MTNIRNALMQAAGTAASGDPVYVEDVFSTHLYTGTGSGIAINNGIDLSGEGGLVIYRRRDGAENWSYQDTERGVDSVVYSDASGAAANPGGYGLASFNSNGFTTELNTSSAKYSSWTFRKQKGFFDCKAVTKSSGSDLVVSFSDLGSIGFVVAKETGGSSNWYAWFKGMTSTHHIKLNSAEAASTDNYITVSGTNVTLKDGVYGSGDSIIYAWADGDDSSAQIFGDDGDEAIIKTGTYTGDGGAGTTEVNVGFEPQWILVRATSAADNWFIIDNMRGWANDNNANNDAYLMPNSSNAESTGGFLDIRSTGFKTTLYSNVNVNGRTYSYMAIRRGPMKEPTAGTDVLDLSTGDNNAGNDAGFPADFILRNYTAGGGDNEVYARLLGEQYLDTNKTGAAASATVGFDHMTTFNSSGWGTSYDFYNWRRYPKVFDVVFYEGTGSTRTVTHNLGVAPEMMIIKNIEQTYHWEVYHSAISPTDGLYLSDSGAASGASFAYASTQPTASVFTVGSGPGVNNTNKNHIALLFASLPGISAVNKYIGTGNDLNVTDLGAAARFVLIKRTDNTGDWYFWDSGRGIVSGNDPYSLLNVGAIDGYLGEITNTDYIDPHSSGFTITSSAPAALNASGGTYIYLAFA